MPQLSDAPARNVPGFWLGDPSAGWRWPFDATFTAWKVWGLQLAPLFFAFWLAVPLGLLVVLGAWRFTRFTSAHLPALRVAGRNATPAAVATLVVLFAVALVPSLRLWLLPMPWWLAMVAAPAVALVVTRAVMPRIGPNTPLSYWAALLPRIAGGPRARREPRVLHAAPASAPSEEVEMHPLEILAMTIDPREVSMGTARPRTESVEFFQWLPAQPARAAECLAWLGGKGVGYRVRDDSFLVIDGVMAVKPGYYAVLDYAGRWSTYTEQGFRADFEVAQ